MKIWHVDKMKIVTQYVLH